jgi:hypothetical protein
MIKKVAAVVLVMIASLFVAGCTTNTTSPTPTPTPSPTSTPKPTPTDYSSALTEQYESFNFTMEQPFTRSTNARGNDVYTGVGSTAPGSPRVTIVIEKTKSKAEAKSVYNATVAAKLKEGYKFNRTNTAAYKNTSAYEEVWVGNSGANWFLCSYRYDIIVHGWIVIQQSPASTQVGRR